MEEGVTIAKVPDWMELKPEMMGHLIREHEKVGRTCVFRSKTTPIPLAKRHSFRSKSALVPKQIGTLYRVS